MDEADVAVIGGSFAGLAAALHVARGRRRVVVVDAGRTRNRFAEASHGFPGQDGEAPAAIRARLRAELLAYPEARLVEAEAAAARDGDGFALAWADGALRARRLVLATGMRDLLPDVPGLAACWGVTANQCPYCHGYELAGRPTAVLMTGAGSLHQARLVTEWGSCVALLLDGRPLGDDDRADLARRGVEVVEAPVARVEAEGGHVRAVVLADGAEREVRALYLAPRFEPASAVAEALGAPIAETEMGRHVVADALMRAGEGLFAAGDVTRPFYNAALSSAEGVRAGAAAHQSLVLDLS